MNYTVPVQIVPGRNGNQPNLSVVYSSQSGNGVMGMGWSVSGLSAITASNSVLYYDGKTEGVRLEKSDPFVLDGMRLIKLSESATQIDYESEQGNVKVSAYLTGSVIKYFKVFFPNGTAGIFGYETNVVQQLMYPLTLFEDGYGNRVSYSYFFRNEHYYISQIDYDGTATTGHFASVGFEYKTRNDINTAYLLGKAITEDYLLDKITCQSGNEVLRTYSFAYEIEREVSLLNKIECSTSTGSLNPLEFYYGDGSGYATLDKQNTQLSSWFSNTSVGNLKIASGKFDYGTNNDGLIVYPNLNPYLETFKAGDLFHHSQKWYQNNFSPEQSLLVYQGLQDSWAAPTVTLTAGTGFINMFAADIDGQPGEEIIKINNYQSGSYDQVNFAIYKPNLYSGISFSHNATFNFSQMLVYYDNLSLHPKYFFGGDFNGDGKMEMLVVSCHNPLGNTSITSRCYLVDLNTGLKLFEGTGLNYTIDFAVLSGVNDDRLFVMDYNGDGKSDICHIHDNAADIYTFDIVGSTYSLRKVASNTNLKKADIKWKEWALGELNGDGKPDVLIAPTASYTNTWETSMPVNAPRFCPNCGQEGTYDWGVCRNCGTWMPESNTCYECGSWLTYEYDETGSYSYVCPYHGASVTVTHSEYVDMGNLWTACFSKGDGTFEKKLIAIKNLEEGEKIVLQDMNKDGVTDLVSNWNGSINVYLAANGAISASSEAYNWVNYGSYVVPSDVASYNYHSQLLSLYNGQVSKLSFSRNDGHQRLLTGAVNSLGVVYKNGYAFLNEGVYTYGYGNDLYTQGFGATFPYENYQGPFTVTARAESWLNDVQQSAMTWHYNNAVLHRQGLGLQGFESITAYDELKGLETTRTYKPLEYGVLAREESAVASVDYEYSITTQSNKLARVRMIKKTANDLLKNTTVTTTYNHDTYGNPSSEVVDYGGGLKTTTLTTFINEVTATKNVTGVPATQTITQGRAGASTVLGSTYTYNAQYSPLSKVSSRDGNTIKQESWSYDGFGNITEEKSKAYNAATWLVTTHEYDPTGRFRTKTTGPLGKSTAYTYNTNGTLNTQTDFKGNITSFEYDDWQRLKKTNYLDGTTRTTSYEWQPAGSSRLYAVKEEFTGSPATKIYYDALGRKTRSSVTSFDGAEIFTDQTYDEYGRPKAASLPFTNEATGWTTNTYDPYDRPTQVITPTGNTITYSYSGTSVTETKNGQSETKTYDAQGQLLSVATSAGTISYTLRPDGQPSSITVPGGIVTSFAYDGYGRQTQLNDPSAGQIQYGYDDAGNLNSQTDANGKTIQTTYDSYNRITGKTSPEFTTTYTYNADGWLQSVTSSNGTSKTFWYDDLGRIIQGREETGTEYHQVNYTYQDGKLQQATHLPLNFTVNYQCNNGYSTMLTDGSGHTLQAINKMNVFGQVEEKLLGNGLLQTHSYDSYGLLTGIKTMDGSTPIQNWELSFDQRRGNLLYRRDVARGLTENFGYDVLDRLTSYGTASQMNYITYNNATGNITSKADAGTYNYSISGKPYMVSSVVGNGSSLPAQKQTVSYTSFARPQQVVEVGYTADFTYSDAYERVKMEMKSSGSPLYTRYYFAGGSYEKTVQANGATKVLLYVDGSPYDASVVVENTNGATRVLYLSRDHLGSITHITDAGKTLVAEYSYDAWGRLRDPQNWVVYAPGSEPGLLLHRGYTGHEHLAEFGLINMNARLYDPLLGRMLSPDNYVQEQFNTQNYNRYSYVVNNPLKYTDPDGDLFVIDDFFIGLIKGTVLSIFGQHEGNHKTVLGDALASAWRNATVSAQIWGGLFKTRSNNFWEATGELLSRFTWQLPQTILGFGFSHMMNMYGTVGDVDYFDGATVLEGNHNGLAWGLGGEAMTVGNYIMGRRGIDADVNNTLFAHEYGHYIQSQVVGPIYLTKYALPSLFSKNDQIRHFHNEHPVEQDANARSLQYFSRYYGGTFNENRFLLVNRIIGYNPGNPINDPFNQAAIASALLRPRWYDYIPGFKESVVQAIYYSILLRGQQP